MATLADVLKLKLKVDSTELNSGLNSAKNSMMTTGKAMQSLGGRWAGVASSLARTVAAPIAGFLSMGSVIKSYFSGVAQVAQMTGQYSTKMEEWRKKRALLARVNKEDIELYKKGREAVTKFQISMADLSSKIMRSAGPAIQWLTNTLSKFSDWITRNSQNIIRFGAVTVGVISAIYIGFKLLHNQLLKTAAAMLMNPLTWIIVGVGALIILIDDLVTYLNGGESVFGAFWGPCIEYAKLAWTYIKNVWDTVKNSTAFNILKKSVIDLWNVISAVFVWVFNQIQKYYTAFGGLEEELKDLALVFSGVFSIIGGVFSEVIGFITMIWGAFVALFTGDTSILEQGWQAFSEGFHTVFSGAINIIQGVLNFLIATFQGFLGLFGVSQEKIKSWGNSLREALNVGRIIDWIKEKLKNMLPDWVIKLMGGTPSGGDEKGSESGGKAASAPTYDSWGYVPPAKDIDKTSGSSKQSNYNDQSQYTINQNFNLNGDAATASEIASAQAGNAVLDMRKANIQANGAVMATLGG